MTTAIWQLGAGWMRRIATGAWITAALAGPVAAETDSAALRFGEVASSVQSSVVTVAVAVVGKSHTNPKVKKPILSIAERRPDEFILSEDFSSNLLKQVPGRKPRYLTSLGSGFIVDASGLVVTNNHVIEGGEEVYVILGDGKELKVEKVLGRDPKTDLTLLKLAPKRGVELKAVQFGDSSRIRVGDWVLAVGNPFGLGGTFTVGIVSGQHRDINAGPYDDFLQTDASINRGNSGGPLFNAKGEVIGINTAIFSPSGGSIGIGFAIPSNTAKRIVSQLLASGKTQWSTLGVRLQALDEDMSKSFGLDGAPAVAIARVLPNSAAERGGLKPGDIVLAADGAPVRTARDLPRLVSQKDVGEPVTLRIWRDRQAQSVTVRVGLLAEKAAPSPQAHEQARAHRGKSHRPGHPLR